MCSSKVSNNHSNIERKYWKESLLNSNCPQNHNFLLSSVALLLVQISVEKSLWQDQGAMQKERTWSKEIDMLVYGAWVKVYMTQILCIYILKKISETKKIVNLKFYFVW